MSCDAAASNRYACTDRNIGWLLRSCHTRSGFVSSGLLLSVADDQGPDGQEVWVALARHRGQGVCV